MNLKLPTVMSPEDTERLEKLVDTIGLDAVLASLATICTLKAEHIRVNWGDEGLAKRWENVETMLDELMTYVASTLP